MNVKLKCTYSQLKDFYSTFELMFSDLENINSIDYLTFYNIKRVLKKTHSKLYSLSFQPQKENKNVVISLDLNECESLKVCYLELNNLFKKNIYFTNTYSVFLSQIQHFYTNFVVLKSGMKFEYLN